MSEKSEKVKDNIRDSVEKKIDELHGVVDAITAPLAPVDGAIHGAIRGVLNWGIDKHPGKEEGECPKTKIPEECQEHGGPTSTPPGQSIRGNSNTQTTVTGNFSGGSIGGNTTNK